ncbi:MAG: VWA domain-containing protein [Candidatus Hydrogenedentes bacterium]|nr:VWA domain-containing protein [Candidatus Hydrogenedentota bacterium]
MKIAPASPAVEGAAFGYSRREPALQPAPGVPYQRPEPMSCVYIVRMPQPPNTETYAEIDETGFLPVQARPLSTFSIDVDTGSYSNVRRFLTAGQLPPADAVRIEELVNYFSYDYAPPVGEHPFAVHLAAMACPWAPKHELVRIGLKGKEIDVERRPPCNLVFLIDVSGSMTDDDKLPLLKHGMQMLTRQLDESDQVGIVTYAGHSGVALPPTRCTQQGKRRILDLIGSLQPGGSTHGSAGIQDAYAMAEEEFLRNGANRVILCTDGDFNVGVTDPEALNRLIEEKAKSGVFLTVLGFGEGNLKDATMEQLADKGNGIYGYIDNISEARKLLVAQMSGSIVTIAKDVKIQVEFNPAEVAAWRLIGYENRLLADEDFNDDTKDAGEIGAGHTVTALYEVVPVGEPVPGKPGVDPLKYQQTPPEPALELTDAARNGELMTVKLRYKPPKEDESKLLSVALRKDDAPAPAVDSDLQFAAAVASFGMILRDSSHARDFTCENVLQMARAAKGPDDEGYRAEFLTLVRNVQELKQ